MSVRATVVPSSAAVSTSWRHQAQSQICAGRRSGQAWSSGKQHEQQNKRKREERQGARHDPENAISPEMEAGLDTFFVTCDRWLRMDHFLAQSLAPHGPPPFLRKISGCRRRRADAGCHPIGDEEAPMTPRPMFGPRSPLLACPSCRPAALHAARSPPLRVIHPEILRTFRPRSGWLHTPSGDFADFPLLSWRRLV